MSDFYDAVARLTGNSEIVTSLVLMALACLCREAVVLIHGIEDSKIFEEVYENFGLDLALLAASLVYGKILTVGMLLQGMGTGAAFAVTTFLWMLSAFAYAGSQRPHVGPRAWWGFATAGWFLGVIELQFSILLIR